MNNIAAVFVLYNPDENLIENINSVIKQVDKIYLIDNSENEIRVNLKEYIESEKKIIYKRLNKNLGIAEALNIALNHCEEDNFQFLLTLDQDSKASENMVAQLYEVISKNDKIALVTAKHFDPSQHKTDFQQSVDEILYTMTSGNLVRVSAAKSVGGFDSKLFIDHVDHEFCLRLKANGFQLKRVNYAILFHKLGKSKTVRILGINFYPSFHNPIRIYYRTRNRLYVNNKYKKIFPDYVKEDLRHFLRELLDIIVCENQRLKKVFMMIKGYIHYKKRIFGPYKSK